MTIIKIYCTTVLWNTGWWLVGGQNYLKDFDDFELMNLRIKEVVFLFWNFFPFCI